MYIVGYQCNPICGAVSEKPKSGEGLVSQPRSSPLRAFGVSHALEFEFPSGSECKQGIDVPAKSSEGLIAVL